MRSSDSEHARDPIAVFEYQGGGHYIGGDAGIRDKIKRIALEKAGIRFVEIKNGTSRFEIGRTMQDIFDKQLGTSSRTH